MTDTSINNNLKISIVNIIWSFDTSNNKVLILLIKNALGYNTDKWGLPTTILRTNENAEEASLRLIREKIGIDLPNFYTEQLATFSDINRSINDREIALSYMTYLPYMPKLTAGYGAKDAQWFEIDYDKDCFILKHNDLVFKTLSEKVSDNKFYKDIGKYDNAKYLTSDHALILRHAFQRVTNRLNYLPTILLILGNDFTLKEAREVYATFWKEPFQNIDNSNFRKTHAHLFTEIGTEHGKSGRPAKLYKLRLSLDLK
ncbi:NUDIX domain-containing protein [Companilactobacillus alimentarius]|uniref:NrtR DNA-binding winged helix domain-containing protein n=1 Tax=Companilactobacillus alimentarius TaxID=1602 RepID=UPI0028B99F4F|nr:NUDIX domain-containing protein [Companilactobacillus alimentarius]MDT6951924.1 ADP-ribose pyrophosphatase [Companilactobacillus alimentarius]